ncbi:MAG: MlaD family protein [Phycisphaerales bacterium]
MNRNNVMAGLFLIGGLLLAVGMSFWLGEASALLGSKTQYVARFDLRTGTAGLQKGSDVTLAGQPVGRVVKVETVYETSESGARVPVWIDVLMAIDSEVVLFEDAYAELNAPLLGGVSAVNIASAGTGAYIGGPEDDNVILDEGEIMRGRLSPGILALAGLDAEAIAKIRETLDSAAAASANVEQITAAFATDAAPSSQSVRAILTDVEGFTTRLDEPGGWADDVSEVLAQGKEFANRLAPVADRIDETVLNAGLMIADARAIINDNRDRLNRTIANVEAVTETVRFESVDRVHEVLDRGVLAASTYTDLGDQLNVILDREYPKIRGAISNVASTTEQASMFVEELRAQPWRVLQQPSNADLEREPLYTATRAYARAVGDLRSAGEALEAVISRTRADGSVRPQFALDPAEVAALRDDVDTAFERYKAAERAMLEQLIRNR